MKKTSKFGLLLGMWLLVQSLSAQVYVADKNINELPEVQVIEMRVFVKPFSKPKFYINYGQEMKDPKDFPLTAGPGQYIDFASVVGAINFLENNGWHFDTPIVVPDGSTSIAIYYFHRKK